MKPVAGLRRGCEVKVKDNIPRIPINLILSFPPHIIDRALLLGPPGIGKTEIIVQYAKNVASVLGREFVDLRRADAETLSSVLENPSKYFVFLRVIATHLFPEDVAIPKHVDDYVQHVPLVFFKVFATQGIAGLLFVDELNNVQRDDQLSMFYSLLLEKELGLNVKLSDSVIIIAAGNESQWSEIARALPKPLLNRLKVLYVVPPGVEDWVGYMDRNYEQWDRRVAAFLQIYKEAMLQPPPDDAENVNFPTPRTWTMLATALPSTPPELCESLCVGLLGPEWGYKFYAFLSVKPRYSLQDVEKNTELFEALEVGEKVFLLSMLAAKDVSEILSFKNFLSYLTEKSTEYFVVFVTLMPREKRVKVILALSKQVAGVVKKISKYIM